MITLEYAERGTKGGEQIYFGIYMKNNYPLVIKYTVATLGRLLLCLTPIRRKADDEDSEYSTDDSYSDDD